MPKKPVKYTADGYFTILRAGGKSKYTIKTYEKSIRAYAKFLKVPMSEVHNHLSPDLLIKFAEEIKNTHAPSTQKTILNILHRYFAVNGVEFDVLEYAVVKRKSIQEVNDKPLTLDTIQKMMDLTNIHGKAMLSFLISTGCRAGEFCQILLTDVHGDTVTIRPETAKSGHGGHVYLTAEAREYLDLWLREREKYLKTVDARSKSLMNQGILRPKNDGRLFGCGYNSLQKWFSRLYKAVDGQKGKYDGNMCTLHSCRKYFRTRAVKTMSVDLVEGLMRHTGYLNSSYVRMPEEERLAEFHAGESALYITRADHRLNINNMNAMKKEISDMKKELHDYQIVMAGIQKGQNLKKLGIKPEISVSF